jgi:hypothetical protein
MITPEAEGLALEVRATAAALRFALLGRQKLVLICHLPPW